MEVWRTWSEQRQVDDAELAERGMSSLSGSPSTWRSFRRPDRDGIELGHFRGWYTHGTNPHRVAGMIGRDTDRTLDARCSLGARPERIW